MHSDDSQDPNGELRRFFGAINKAAQEQAEIVQRARGALMRLARAAYGHDNGQAVTITRWLASIYNGDEGRPVQLDEIRRLDWSLQRDLVDVMLGIGAEGFPDTEIRAAFEEIAGGKAGADWLHYWTSGKVHREALDRLVAFARSNAGCPSGQTIARVLRSMYVHGATTELSRLAFVDNEHSRDVVLVLDALFGRSRGVLHLEDIRDALAAAGLLEEASIS